MNRAILFLLLTATNGSLFAQESDPFAPAGKLADGWEQIDQRLVFLMVRLVDVEANLEAVDIAMLKHGARAGAARGRAIRAQRGSDRMDRNAGGPVRWDQFYGRTAEKFFYHPTQNHTYHTQTILSHQSPSRDNKGEAGVPSSQGLPVHQRPPQFDYIYRANENARQRATTEVAKLGNKIDVLAERRHELELQQCKLWCEVAFRAVSRNDLDKKPLYRFQPKSTVDEGLEESAKFVMVSLSIVENAQKNQASTFRQMKPLISEARDNLANNWSQHGVKYRVQSSNEWKFAMLARHLEDVASNLSDSYTVSVDSARNSDDDRRDMYRGLLQQSLVQYAEAVLALDEMASEMAKVIRYEPDFDNAIEVPFTPASASTPYSEMATPSVVAAQPSVLPSLVGTFRIKWLEGRTGNSGFSNYQFTSDGKALKEGEELGAWTKQRDEFMVRFSDSKRGHVIIRFADESTILGTHFWTDGSQSTWDGKRVAQPDTRNSPLVGYWVQTNGWAIEIFSNGQAKNTSPKGTVDAIGTWQVLGNGKFVVHLGKQWEWRVSLQRNILYAETFLSGARKAHLTFTKKQ
ncbi:hypothetical protein EC9_53130 [Rosistilla ulvae]|uniref:Uncharacterized protein n=1 Tax=Rosistilla ulvae TaxID=1930277 RepID=A0A517M891_9BACT|nr:hypothetical protein [Rosistilla ulvae]QDS91093.1 hypothetical protein EC9_53130 [Rosistilla ulvae]